ncbi:MAG TPA: hypothetical protein VGR81_13650 [Candidatus Acidoferrales bacterium]|nr:hypothetical protein [Candidatus Acidoferrales bacterium]
MLVWRGKGFLVALIAFGCLILTDLATRSMFTDKGYYQHHGWPKLVGFFIAAVSVYALRSWFGCGRERILIERETGQEVKISLEDSLLGIPVRFWPFILLGLGVVFSFVRE